jgi:hypothetical protein
MALLLAVVLSPGVAEVTEDFAHWISLGHTIHASAEHAAHAAGEEAPDEHATDEHGCTTLFHVCACHSPAPSMITMSVSWERTQDLTRDVVRGFFSATRRVTADVVNETFRPPIA